MLHDDSLINKPFDSSIPTDIEADSFSSPSVDSKSIELVKKGKAGQRYAFVGWYKKPRWHIRFRPGYDFDVDSNMLENAKKLFGEGNYVVADEKISGIVHKTLEIQITAEEPGLVGIDKDTPKIFKIAGSFFKISDESFLWINRSTANINISRKNELALCCFTFEKTKFDFKHPKYTLDYHLMRSLDEKNFKSIAENTTPIIGGKIIIYNDESLKENCYSFDIANEWDKIAEMKAGPEKNKIIHDMLMRTIYIASGIEPDKDGDGYEAIVLRTLKIAKSENIILNLEYIPPGFDTQSSETALSLAAKRGYKNLVKILIDHGSNVCCVTEKDETLPPYAIEHYIKKNEEFIRAVLDNKIPIDQPNSDNLTLLYMATMQQDQILIYKLLEKNANVNLKSNGDTLLLKAIQQNNDSLIDLFLSHSADPNLSASNDLTPLLLAVKNKNVTLIEKLLKHGAKPDPIDAKGITPLHQAILSGDLESVKLLLRYGANPNASSNNITPLEQAIILNNQSIIDVLLKAKADPNLTTPSGTTPLALAAKQVNIDVLLALLEAKANPNTVINEGQTLLHIATANGNLKMVQYLIKRKASIMLEDKDGNTPLSIAMENGHDNIIKELLNAVTFSKESFDKGYKSLEKLVKELRHLEKKFQSAIPFEATQALLKELNTLISTAYKNYANIKDDKRQTNAENNLKESIRLLLKNPNTEIIKFADTNFLSGQKKSTTLKQALTEIIFQSPLNDSFLPKWSSFG
jgi:ankyrin repeat protein